MLDAIKSWIKSVSVITVRTSIMTALHVLPTSVARLERVRKVLTHAPIGRITKKNDSTPFHVGPRIQQAYGW